MNPAGAEIRAATNADGQSVILLNGIIENGDAAKLKRVRSELFDNRLRPEGVYLNSPGGSFSEALRIVEFIVNNRHGPIGTRVDKGAECYSACAVVFMAGQTSGGSMGRRTDRKLHYQGQLGFHAPYPEGVQGEYSGTDIEETHRLAIRSLRELLKQKIIPASLMIEMLGKEPTDALMVDTVHKAIHWDIDIIGFSYPKLTK